MTTAPPLIQCKYCKHIIYLDEPGWGFDDNRDFFHMECAEQFDDIRTGDDDAETDF